MVNARLFFVRIFLMMTKIAERRSNRPLYPSYKKRAKEAFRLLQTDFPVLRTEVKVSPTLFVFII
jgi:hypothetical protein